MHRHFGLTRLRIRCRLTQHAKIVARDENFGAYVRGLNSATEGVRQDADLIVTVYSDLRKDFR